MSAKLSDDEIERYARHIVMPEIGGAGQAKLKAARVLVVGAGGLGAAVLQYLAAAGVGTLGIADDDVVSLSNLQRQVIHDTNAIGVRKVESAAASIQGLNPHVMLETHDMRVDESTARDLVDDYDIVVDCTDNFAARFLLADVCAEREKPLVTGAVSRFDGSVTALMPFNQAHDGRFNPGYRDLFPHQPPDYMVPTCAQAGVVGAVTGVIGTIQAMEIIKLITNVGEPLVGRLLLYDGLAGSFQTIRYKAD